MERPTSDSKLSEVYPGIDGVVYVLGDAQQRPHPALQQLQQSVLALHIGGLVQGVEHPPQHEVTQAYAHRPGVGPPCPATHTHTHTHPYSLMFLVRDRHLHGKATPSLVKGHSLV